MRHFLELHICVLQFSDNCKSLKRCIFVEVINLRNIFFAVSSLLMHVIVQQNLSSSFVSLELKIRIEF